MNVVFSYDEDYQDVLDYEYDEIIENIRSMPLVVSEVARVEKAIDMHVSPGHTNSSQALQRLNETLGIYL